MGEPLLTIGELARRAGVATSAVRHWEELGLLPAPARVSGQRRYPESAVERVGIVLLFRDAGFTLAEQKAMLTTRGVAQDEWRRLAERKLVELDEKIAKAAAAREAIEHGLRCPHPELTDCPTSPPASPPGSPGSRSTRSTPMGPIPIRGVTACGIVLPVSHPRPARARTGAPRRGLTVVLALLVLLPLAFCQTASAVPADGPAVAAVVAGTCDDSPGHDVRCSVGAAAAVLSGARAARGTAQDVLALVAVVALAAAVAHMAARHRRAAGPPLWALQRPVPGRHLLVAIGITRI
ncbi:hypothetical protein BJF78_11965 [Pseudonocardia sp. CNS-139]|nr:hypothetical protein BJF78_11965 [Pseudonocardia sp. CNS-139]